MDLGKTAREGDKDEGNGFLGIPLLRRAVTSLLLDRLHAAGLRDVTTVVPVEGYGCAGGVATQRGRPARSVKSFAHLPADDMLAAETEALAALR